MKKNSYMLVPNHQDHNDDDDIDNINNNEDKPQQRDRNEEIEDDNDDYGDDDYDDENSNNNNQEHRNLLNNNVSEEDDEEIERNVILFSNRDPSISIFATPTNPNIGRTLGSGEGGGLLFNTSLNNDWTRFVLNNSSTNNSSSHFPFPRSSNHNNNYYNYDDDDEDDEDEGDHQRQQVTIDINQLNRNIINSPSSMNGISSSSSIRQPTQLKPGDAVIISEPGIGINGSNISVGFNNQRFKHELNHDGSHNLAAFYKDMVDPQTVRQTGAVGDDDVVVARLIDDTAHYLSEHRYEKAKKLLSSITFGEIIACVMISLEVPFGSTLFLLVFIVLCDIAVLNSLNHMKVMSYLIFGTAFLVLFAGFFIPIPSVISLIRLITFMVSLNARREMLINLHYLT